MYLPILYETVFFFLNNRLSIGKKRIRNVLGARFLIAYSQRNEHGKSFCFNRRGV